MSSIRIVQELAGDSGGDGATWEKLGEGEIEPWDESWELECWDESYESLAHLEVLADDHVLGEEAVSEVDGQEQGFGH